MPPFNLSCQVRIRCFYIRGEWAVEVQLDCWGQLLCTAATLKPPLVLPCQFWVFPRSVDPFRWAFIHAHRAAGIRGPEGCPLAFHLGLNPTAETAMHLPNSPVSLCSSLEIEEVTALLGQCSSVSSSHHRCLFQERCRLYVDTTVRRTRILQSLTGCVCVCVHRPVNKSCMFVTRSVFLFHEVL